MKALLVSAMLLLAVGLAPVGARAHCDAVDGPVATAAVNALETRNVNLILPYVPAEAEAELTVAFDQALIVRANGAAAKALADRYFMEVAVRLHRAGEKAPYTGLKPAGTDFGPAIPAAERALEMGTVDELVALISREIVHGIGERFTAATATNATKTPETQAGVAGARARVSAELGFIGYVETLYQAAKGGAHAE